MADHASPQQTDEEYVEVQKAIEAEARKASGTDCPNCSGYGGHLMTWDTRYRQLNAGETILPGDEVQVDDPFGWKPAACVFQPAPDPAYTAHRIYRRALATQAERDTLKTHLEARTILERGEARKFKLGDRVTKIRGSSWTGRICGLYSTTLTPEGYCVESETETGSVQIYPAAALKLLEQADE